MGLKGKEWANGQIKKGNLYQRGSILVNLQNVLREVLQKGPTKMWRNRPNYSNLSA
jgi:hypothetical protein